MNMNVILSVGGVIVAGILVKAYMNSDIRCPNCGERAELDDSKKFWLCRSCGHKVERRRSSQEKGD